MEVRFFACLFFLVSTISCFGQINIDKMRADYSVAVKDKKVCETNLNILEKALKLQRKKDTSQHMKYYGQSIKTIRSQS